MDAKQLQNKCILSTWKKWMVQYLYDRYVFFSALPIKRNFVLLHLSLHKNHMNMFKKWQILQIMGFTWHLRCWNMKIFPKTYEINENVIELKSNCKPTCSQCHKLHENLSRRRDKKITLFDINYVILNSTIVPDENYFVDILLIILTENLSKSIKVSNEH